MRNQEELVKEERAPEGGRDGLGMGSGWAWGGTMRGRNLRNLTENRTVNRNAGRILNECGFAKRVQEARTEGAGGVQERA